ncbi:MAG TPA: D-amino acid dehydrogenase, partial [Rhodospirillaceae bacterium]|nr:D-amino acid dehydrogenase [Rhodospirillaceae bacterium]
MRVIVLGAGVIGVTTAYYLARQGADVVVIDRQRGPGMETSFANAGELSYGMSSPWAAPGIPMKALKWLFMRHRPLFIWPLISPTMWKWCLQLLMNCNEASYALNKSRMVRVSNYSRDALTELMDEVTIDFDQRDQGTLQLFRTEKQVKAAKADQAVLDQFNSPYEVLDRDGCIAAEPGLRHVADKFVGGLRLMADRTGDCRAFTQALSEKAAELGVEFHYNVVINRFVSEQGKIIGVETEQGLETADRYVCALGPYAPILLKTVGIRL